MCVILHDGRVLGEHRQGGVKGEAYICHLGGGVEFGETAEAALRREFMEEIGAELTNVRLESTFENLFQ
jgi:8-oxo-dGTP pyrophosphatase MutT (NUDIX family)